MIKGQDYTGVTIVYLCHDGIGNILLNKRSKNCRDEHGCFDCGGGGLDFGDSVEETLSKEIMEEYCCEIINSEFLGYRDIHRTHDGKRTHWIALDFLVHVNKEQVQNGEPHKFDEVNWFTVDTLPQPLHSQFPNFLEKYKNKINSIHQS